MERPVVPLSWDKEIFLSRCPFVPGQGQEQITCFRTSFFVLEPPFLLCPARRDGSGCQNLVPSRPTSRCGFWHAVPDFELVPLSLCPETMKELLFLCPEKLHRPVGNPNIKSHGELFFWNRIWVLCWFWAGWQYWKYPTFQVNILLHLNIRFESKNTFDCGLH